MAEHVPMIEGFDEKRYLEANPDIRDALNRGLVTSGLAHYRAFGRWEGRSGAPRLAEAAETGFANLIPPAELRRRVHGSEDLRSFEQNGMGLADDLWTVAKSRIALDAGQGHALEFGCGCGRVMNYLGRMFPGTLDGTDIDGEAIGWCQENLHEVGTFAQNGEWPPLPYGEDTFDFVYSVSVFTHLPQPMEGAWLAELRRVAKPGALLLLSVHGENLFPKTFSDEAAQFAKTGFAYLQLGSTAGLPDFYQTAYHSPRYVRERWGQMFEIETILPAGVGNQDLVVCRKPGTGQSRNRLRGGGPGSLARGFAADTEPRLDLTAGEGETPAAG